MKNRAGRCTRPAFFLIEQLIICALFALIYSFAFYTTTFFNGMLARFELHNIVMSCRALQWQAISSNQPQTLQFDQAAHSYTAAGATHKLCKQLEFGAQKGVKGPPSSPTHAITKPITFSDNQITAAPTGVLSSGTVYVQDTTRGNSYALTNAVSAVSQLRLYRWEKNKWKSL